MGRVLLIGVALAGTLACSGGSAGNGQGGDALAGQQAQDPHGELACAACHQGARADLGRAAVPRAACTAAGCHADGGPAEVELATARFGHRDHTRNAAIQASCAGCHTHDAGGEPLHASVDACAICHLSEVAGQEAQDCRLCHQRPQHVQLTSQGVPVPHSSLPWIETGCVRCHYDVAEPPVEVRTSRCTTCHADVAAVTRSGIGEDLHPAHDGTTCTACHEARTHHVRAMSSAVDLVCADCHTEEHGVPVTDDPGVSATCSTCHQGTHAAQQRLVLGVLPGVDGQASPSTKFLAGLTCRSCHVPPAADGGNQPVRGQASACAGCHRDEYETVLGWWLEGLQQRQAEADRYLDAARRDIGGAAPDTARQLLARARTLLDVVRQGGGQHNLELSDRIFRRSIEMAARAYDLAGRQAPAPPQFGVEPHAGLCSFCHYRADEPWDYARMSEPFHEDILRQTGNR